jgi:CHAT domain-containing protein
LIAIRSETDQPVPQRKVVAVIADPVYSRHDDRVGAVSSSPAVASAAPNENESIAVDKALAALKRDGAPVRLISAGEEADAILAVAPRGAAMVAKGFDATSETVMSLDFRTSQILHFATHSFLDKENPESSGIVLTMVDRNGAARNGVMPLHDIYNLDLSAQLTVLSACQTALGKDVKGEGLVGLTHSFISAGSKSVVASLWKVDDRATAALMTEFYRAMLHDGMPTAAALRAAKLKMMQDKRVSAPYYWAGFVLQGEYTNRITVEPDSSVNLPLLLLFLLGTSAGLIVLRKRRRGSAPPRRV